MTIIEDNQYSIDWKLFVRETEVDAIAIVTLFGLAHRTKYSDLSISINNDPSNGKNNTEIVKRYEKQIYERFKNPIYILGVDVSDYFVIDHGLPYVHEGLGLQLSLLARGHPVGSYQDAMFLNSSPQRLPDRANIVRVAGQISTVAFLLGGASWFHNLHRLVRDDGQVITKDSRVLDWGCGCGRLTRHFLASGFRSIYGVDIDPVNINWMTENFGSNFVLVDTIPPTDFSSHFFDCVVGHSVFTHLDEEAQFRWLGELRRVLKPGARAYVTICSDRGVAITGPQGPGSVKEKVQAVIENGIVDFGHQNVGVDVLSPGYYRLTSHSHEYIRDRWSEYFDVVKIIPFFAAQQDLVVLENRI